MRWIDTFPWVRQYDSSDCGLACLSMICKYYGMHNNFTINDYQYFISKDGISLESIVEIAKLQDFDVKCGKIEFAQLKEAAPLSCILYWDRRHFVVLYDIIEKGGNSFFKIADPGKRKLCFSEHEFFPHWSENIDSQGIVILLEPKNRVPNRENKKKVKDGISLFDIIVKYKTGVFLIGLGVFIGAIIQLVLPFLTQYIVDVGIEKKSLHVILMILLGQMALATGDMANDFFRRSFVLKIGYHFSSNLLTEMVKKMLLLPARFFDSRQIGDLLQRLQDNAKIERFLTTHFVDMVFSIVTIVVLGGVMLFYSTEILSIFIIGSLLYVFWASFFVKRKKRLNYSLFNMKAKNQSKYLEIIKGIYEIKLDNDIENNQNTIGSIQKEIYKLNLQSFKIDLSIEIGQLFLNETKNFIITFLSAYFVIKQEFSFGMMLSIQYIIGEMNVPINQLITYINGYQDAKFSLERLNSIFTQKDEYLGHIKYDGTNANRIKINDLSFKYIKSGEDVLHHINLDIPMNKTIAIVGASGSGKTTLVKLLLKLYPVESGKILIGDTALNDIDTISWRQNCGAVMQEGYIFSDTIKNNIILNNPYEEIRFNQAVRMANVDEFVLNFAYKYETKIGSEGLSMSQGQKQRILIARTIYKAPKIIFFDEATNSLDAKNERVIVTNMNNFLKGRTAFIVAHRLSTVKNADIILVMDHGEIIEQGNHKSLVDLKGYYYQLIKNQLEIAE